ncbi:MAG: hypothetical protein A2Y67_01290 [Candidatus Buchananbacteria bacterium RBG_13_39_9]|uniref:Uncharacterized protein n=1 Tax=Candidatus Buchananbacteria bacterium RBG_13_39_9 TaxID=1797531 RepID=A0A1G1XMN5_9BACT|nr:MAG: hypothetical protein A2Y67_01290 [Candidatus Buchananbacteria bacterium RBG_13_39_9]
MQLPYVEDGNLHIENACFPLKNFSYDAMLELIPPEKKVKVSIDHRINRVEFAFPNSSGRIEAIFLFDSMQVVKGTYVFGSLLFTEMHFQLYQQVHLDALMEDYGQVQLIECDDIQLAAFNSYYLAEIDKGLVKCLWFINPVVIKISDDPFYTALREIFE